MQWLLVTAGVVPSPPILVTLMKDALATRRNIPEDTILHSSLSSHLLEACQVLEGIVIRKINCNLVHKERRGELEEKN
jgi:hypothetical protein